MQFGVTNLGQFEAGQKKEFRISPKGHWRKLIGAFLFSPDSLASLQSANANLRLSINSKAETPLNYDFFFGLSRKDEDQSILPEHKLCSDIDTNHPIQGFVKLLTADETTTIKLYLIFE